jgi:hypothetical protein
VLAPQLLIRDPAERLGHTGGFQQVKAHAFFKDVDWTAVLRKELTPPIVPSADFAAQNPVSLTDEEKQEVCEHIYVCVCGVCECVCVCVCVRESVCAYVYERERESVCVRACVSACACVCVCVRLCACSLPHPLFSFLSYSFQLSHCSSHTRAHDVALVRNTH